LKKGPGIAFGNRIAKVYTTPLNKRATDASALPAANASLVYIGNPIQKRTKLRGREVIERDKLKKGPG